MLAVEVVSRIVTNLCGVISDLLFYLCISKMYLNALVRIIDPRFILSADSETDKVVCQ